MKILLVNPNTAADILSGTAAEIPYLDSEAFIAPHAVATVAALTPGNHQVSIHDEQVRGPVESLLEERSFDVVGISLQATQLSRTIAIVRFFRESEQPGGLVIGGIGASYMPDRLKNDVNSVFLGEAETTWPRYLEDLGNGRPQSEYRQDERTDMTTVPAPRWDLIGEDIPRYGAVPVQTTRGCPFNCNFCDVIKHFGNRPRSKTVAQVVEEIRTAEKMGTKVVYFADDNFGGKKRNARELLRGIKEVNNSFEEPLGLMTQVDITIAADTELLELMADSNMNQVQVGIESLDEGVLKEMNKVQNLRLDSVDACHRIQSHGIVVMAHLIAGADSDDMGVFDRFGEFLQKANIVNHLCHPLSAPPGTELYEHIRDEGRIVESSTTLAQSEMEDRRDILTNIVPKGMTRVQLFEGMADYLERVHEPDDYVNRILGFIRGVSRRPRVKDGGFAAFWKRRKMMFRMFRFFLIQSGKEQRRIFLAIMKATRKQGNWLMPRVMFAHTGYVMDRMRARPVVKLAREQARYEADHPETVKTLPPRASVVEKGRAQDPATGAQ